VLARAAALRRRPGVLIMAAFVALPAAVYGLPAALGVPWLVSDNLIQNFPLRVLVGIDLRHGHAPVWDPYLWSGSPLLSGFNAGAAYPTTWLFGVLPGALAWVVNQALVEVVAAAGMVVLLRVLGRSWTASGLGALAFSYGGFMVAQNVHIDVVAAGAWLPWAFAALDRLANRPEGRSAAPWVGILGASVGLMGLSGAAEPILDGGLALAVYAAWLLWRTPARRGSLVVGIVAGVALGLALAGAQLVPGALVQAQSQRAVHDYWYFTSGSMNKSLTVLGLDPMLLGTATFPLPFVGTYNLNEVSSYIGIMPLMGLVGLLARRHRANPEARQWRIWYAIAALGLVLTWGDFTPLGHVFFHLPLFNRQRLLSRNLLEVDLAVAVLFAAWLDHMLLSPAPKLTRTGEVDRVPEGSPWWRRLAGPEGWRSDVVLPLIPPVAVIGLQIVLLAGGPWLPHFINAPGTVTRSSMLSLGAFLTIPSAIAVGAMGLVLRRRRLATVMPRLLTALVVVDLAVFNIFIQAGPDPHGATGASPTADALSATVAAQGPGAAGGLHRVGMFDPDRYYTVQVEQLGEPDLTILRSLGSVQGYGAVVDARYDQATGTHLQLNMTPASLSDGTFAPLDLGVLASVPEYFVHVVTAAPASPLSVFNGSTPIPPVAPSSRAPVDTTTPPPTPTNNYLYAPAPAQTLSLVPGRPRTQYLGTVLSVTSVIVPVQAGSPGPAANGSSAVASPAPEEGVRVGLVSPDGRRTTWIGSAPAGPGPPGTAVVTAPAPTAASGIVLEATPGGSVPSAPVTIGAAVLRTEGQGTYRVDGSLRDAVAPGRWRFAGMIGQFCIFTEASAAGRAWVEKGPSGAAHIVSSTPWGDETIRVTTARPATLVRSEQFATGWQATVTTSPPHGGPPSRHAVPVRRQGLIQAVSVPAGTSLVHFTYRPHRVLEGFVASALGFTALVVFVVWPVFRRRRRGVGARRRAAR
jgi:hypothetical protein